LAELKTKSYPQITQRGSGRNQTILKGWKWIAVGERLCAMPTEVWSRIEDPERVRQWGQFDPFRVGWCDLLVPWASRKALVHGY